jgi:hypothetical protein
MKKIYYIATLLVLAVMPTLFTSCDDDPWYRDHDDDWYDNYDWYDDAYTEGTSDLVTMAQTLNGTWSGSATNEYTNDDGDRERTTFDADFTFVQYSQNSSNGTGYETDYDDEGNEQTLRFKWYIDPRTYNIYIEYVNSGYRYVLCESGNSDTSGFFLGYDKSSRKDVFNGVMEGVNNDEYIYFDCDRVTSNNVASRLQTKSTVVTGKSYGKAKGFTRTDSSAPKKLRKR